MIWTFLYFVFPSSAVLLIGLGTNRIFIASDNLSTHTILCLKALLGVCSSAVLTFLFTNAVLVPINLQEIFPIVAIFIFLSISALLEVLIRISTKKNAAEFTVSIFALLISVWESTSLSESVLISFACIFSFYFTSFLVHAIRHRTLFANPAPCFSSKVCQIWMALAFLTIALGAINVSWLNMRF